MLHIKQVLYKIGNRNLKLIEVWDCQSPLLHQKKISDVSVFYSIAAHIKFIQGDNIFGIVVADIVIHTKFAADGLV